MLITKEKMLEAYRTMSDAYRFYDRFEGTESKPVRIYYLMDWYREYFRDISKEEKEEVEDMQKAAFRRFTPADWDYVIRCSSGMYAKMAWDRRKRKYLNQLRQNQMLDDVIGYLKQ